eukprot:4532398-Prymnesium_polylepis.1
MPGVTGATGGALRGLLGCRSACVSRAAQGRAGSRVAVVHDVRLKGLGFGAGRLRAHAHVRPAYCYWHVGS